MKTTYCIVWNVMSLMYIIVIFLSVVECFGRYASPTLCPLNVTISFTFSFVTVYFQFLLSEQFCPELIHIRLYPLKQVCGNCCSMMLYTWDALSVTQHKSTGSIVCIFTVVTILLFVAIGYLHCESKKGRCYTLVHIFAKYWPIFIILSPTFSVENLQ